MAAFGLWHCICYAKVLGWLAVGWPLEGKRDAWSPVIVNNLTCHDETPKRPVAPIVHCTIGLLVWSSPILTCFAQPLAEDRAGNASSNQTASRPQAQGQPAGPDVQPLKPEIQATPTTWPLFRGDSFASGRSPTTLPQQLKVLWRYEVPNGAFEATAVIAEDRVFIGDLDGELYALNLKTGKEIWKYETDSGFIASPAFLPAQDSQTTSANERRTHPACVVVGDYDGGLHCVNVNSGQLIWKFASNAEISASANFYEGNVLFGSQDTRLYCVNAATGELIWKHSLQDQIRCSPTIVNGRCFVAGCDQQLHVIDIESGDSLATVPIDAPTGVTPAVQGKLVFFGTEAGQQFAVNWHDAQIVWTFSDPRSSQPIRSCPAVADDTVVFGSRSKKVYAVDTRTGDLKWMFPTRNRVDSSPVIVGRRVFVGSGDGRLYEINLDTGRKNWDYETGGSIVGAPAVAANRIVVANDRGVVYCFGEEG